jgi:hypothetical protein
MPMRSMVAGVLIGLAAVVWFTTLSGWLGVTPKSVLLARQNVLFNSDTNTWVEETVNQQTPSPSGRVIHPLAVFFWRPQVQVLRRLLNLLLPREQAGVLSARLVVALIAGAGAGCLSSLALTLGLELPQCVLLFAMYLLFTSSSTIALPEHFGISNGLLSMAFAIPVLVSSYKVRTAALAALAVVCAGTTVTNVLYPLAGLYQWSIRSVRARWVIIVTAVITLPIAVFLFVDSRKVVLLYTDADKDIALRASVLPAHVPGITRWYLKATKIHGHVADYLNLRLLSHPSDAAAYALYAVVAPAVGPSPVVRRTKGSDMVTYESGQPLHWNPNGYFTGSDGVSLRAYWSVQGIGALLWLGLLLSCTYYAFHDSTTRTLAWLPAGWILFSLVFHNLWGDELFLYAPHWSWALMALVLLGARRLSLITIATLVMPIWACQIYTLLRIKSALLAIT